MTAQKNMANKRELLVTSPSDEQKDSMMAKVMASPSLNAASLQLTFHPNSGLALMACMDEMKEQFSALQKGDTDRIEAMLLGQAHSLQAIFTHYANKMASAEYLNQLKVNGALAMKAQNQCRQTLAALAEIKNPKRATFIKNQATNQQINLHAGSEIPDKKTPILSNELLSEGSHAAMDTTGTRAAGNADKAMATLEKSGR